MCARSGDARRPRVRTRWASQLAPGADAVVGPDSRARSPRVVASREACGAGARRRVDVPWSSARPSPAPRPPVTARERLGSGSVLLVGDVVEPGHDLAVLVGFLDGDVGHEPVGGGSVPVLLAGLDVDDVAGADLLDAPGARVATADAVGDVEGLALGVGCQAVRAPG